MNRIWIATLVTALGCSKGPSAMDVCKQIEATGVASNCRTDTPRGLGLAAKELVAFDLTNVSGKSGQVLKFADVDTYTKTVDAYDAAAMLAGPHRYGSKTARVFVQANSGLSGEDGMKIRGVVSALGELRAPPAEWTQPSSVAQQAASTAPLASATAASVPSEPSTPALAVCLKLKAAQIAAICKAKAPDGEMSTAIFKASVPDAGGIVVVFDDAKMFDGVVKKQRAEAGKGKHVAASPKTRTMVSWDSNDPELDAKITSVVDAL